MEPLILLFPNQIRNNHVSVAIVFLIVVGENVWAIAVIENMLIYEEEDAELWIGYPLDVCNVLEDGDLQALIGRAEFDVSHTYLILRSVNDRRRVPWFEV